MKRSVLVVGLAVVLLSLIGCAVTINMRDGTARIDRCPGVEFQIIVQQGPHQPSVRAVASGGQVQFSSQAFRDIDFSRRVTVIIFASTIPPNSDCPIRINERYRLADVILPPVSGESGTYQVNLADFQKMP